MTEPSLLRSRICARLALLDITREYGPPSQLSDEERQWRREDLLSVYLTYLQHRVLGVGRTWQEALLDAAATGRLGPALPLVPEADEAALEEVRDVLRHGAMTDWIETEYGIALLDACW